MQDKYTTTPLKHPNALSKGNMHIYLQKRIKLTPLETFSKRLVLLKSNLKMQT